jgi:thiamine biosynthesis lipoprotein
MGGFLMRTQVKNARVVLSISAIVFLAAAVACGGQGMPLSRTDFVFWTTCTVTLYDHAEQANLDAAFARMREIHTRLSVNVPESELDAVSAAAGGKSVRVTDDVLFVIKKALRLSALSDGLFDPTVGPLMKVWKMNTGEGRIPAPQDIARARSLVSWRDVVVDDSAKTIFMRRAGMSLDAGAVLKGYAADETVRILASRGVRSAMIDFGGDIFAMGSKVDGSPWRIGIQNPESERGTPFGTVGVVGKSVVTSGVYEHFFIQNGKRYHHIMDTRTGYPVDNGLVSVTVISSSSLDADGIGLTLFCLGPSRGLALADTLGVDALMVSSDHKLYATDGMKKMLTITDPGFTYAVP